MTALGWKGAGRAAQAVAKRFKPKMARAARASGYDAWRRAVAAVRAAALNTSR